MDASDPRAHGGVGPPMMAGWDWIDGRWKPIGGTAQMVVRFVEADGVVLRQVKFANSYDQSSRPMRETDKTEHPEAWAAFLAARNSTGKAPVQEGK